MRGTEGRFDFPGDEGSSAPRDGSGDPIGFTSREEGKLEGEGAEERGLPGPRADTVTNENRVDSGRCRAPSLDRNQRQRCGWKMDPTSQAGMEGMLATVFERVFR